MTDGFRGQAHGGHTSRNVLFHNLERRTTEALLSSPRSGQLILTQFTLTLQFWGGQGGRGEWQGLGQTLRPALSVS